MLWISQGLNSLFGSHFGAREKGDVWDDESHYTRSNRSSVQTQSKLETFEEEHNQQLEQNEAKKTKVSRDKVIRHTLKGAGTTFLVLGALSLLVGLLYHFGVLQLMLHKAVVIGSANPIAWQTTVYGGVLFTTIGGTLFGIQLARDGAHRKVASFVSRSFRQMRKKVGDKIQEYQIARKDAAMKHRNDKEKVKLIEAHITEVKEEYDLEIDEESDDYSSVLKAGESIVAESVIIDRNHVVVGSVYKNSDAPQRMNYSIYNEGLVVMGEAVYNNVVFNKDGEPVARLREDHSLEKWVREDNPTDEETKSFLTSPGEWAYDRTIYSGTNKMVARIENRGNFQEPVWKRINIDDFAL